VTARVAAVDCGTNSIRLLIADADAEGRLVDVVRDMRIVRLGQGVDRTGRLAPAAIARTRDALVDYAELIDKHGASAVRMVATSATRDAANRDDFVEMVRAVLGADPEVITGAEEAELSFAGALAGLPGAQPPVLVADIGGGSTELVLGDAQSSGDAHAHTADAQPHTSSGDAHPHIYSSNAQLRSHSMDVGCVRMTERHLRSDPPTADQIAATVSDVRAAVRVASRDVPIGQAATFVGVAGTVTTLAAIVHGLPSYDPAVIHGSSMTAAQVHEVTERLLAMTHEQRAALPVMHPGRVDVIGGGAIVLRELVIASGVAGVVASEHDILDGIALRLLDDR
jgi:exopolyphosphatase/guanosine-5'-triphosphate,3'-diphosphate pyrophosphatase